MDCQLRIVDLIQVIYVLLKISEKVYQWAKKEAVVWHDISTVSTVYCTWEAWLYSFMGTVSAASRRFLGILVGGGGGGGGSFFLI